MYILLQGNVTMNNKTTKIQISNTGEYFGEIFFFTDTKSQSTYETEGQISILYELEFFYIIETIGKDYLNIILKSIYLGLISDSEKLVL